MARALVVVDVQNDFLPGGALAVPNGDRVLRPLRHEIAEGNYEVVVFSRDTHPPNHCSFVEQGGPWPKHCVVGTPGALIAAGLTALRPAHALPLIVHKGAQPDSDAYSAFDGEPPLAPVLHARGVTELVVGGLATDYCVEATVLNALSEGFKVAVLEDAVAAVNVEPHNGERALAGMQNAGARLLQAAGATAAAIVSTAGGRPA